MACHDGFTLADLVAYASKHNRANGEENRDGSGANWSSGWGAEGATHDPAILARRARVQRCLLATTVFALGVPMIGQGDEVGRTQRGNNNAYCQDDPELWVPWGPDADADLLAFASHAFALRRANAVFRRDTFFPGDGSAVRWLAPDGSALAGARWQHPPDGGHTLVMHLLAPASSADRAADALLLLHSGRAPIPVRLPPGSWRLRLDSARPALRDEELLAPALRLAPSCFALLERA